VSLASKINWAARVAGWRAKGLCSQCGGPPAPPSKLCVRHGAKSQAYNKARVRREQQARVLGRQVAVVARGPMPRGEASVRQVVPPAGLIVAVGSSWVLGGEG
jgi:hypothetical protein